MSREYEDCKEHLLDVFTQFNPSLVLAVMGQLVHDIDPTSNTGNNLIKLSEEIDDVEANEALGLEDPSEGDE